MQKCGDLGDQTEDYIKLANDIYLNDISAINWVTGTPKAGYTVNKWTPNKFNGVLDGGGHMIYGLYVDTNPVSYAGAYHNAGAGVGLVASDRCSEWSWISFKNLGMDKVYVNGANCASALSEPFPIIRTTRFTSNPATSAATLPLRATLSAASSAAAAQET